MPAGRISVRSVVIGTLDKTVRFAAERMVNAYVLEVLTADHGAAARILEESGR